MMLNNTVIRERLIDDFDCKESQVDGVVAKISRMAPDIYAAFESWFNTGVVKEIEVEGYTVASLRAKKRNMNIVGAYLTLDWLRREPDKAKFALSQPEILNSVITKKVVK
ncbi:MAG: hypothetical protein N2376_10630 [Clostridia bacterium]|nr:hypothetical protein [Clostridia bacterium]